MAKFNQLTHLPFKGLIVSKSLYPECLSGFIFSNVLFSRESGEFYLSSAASTMQNSVQNYLSHELPQIDALTSDLNMNLGIVSYSRVLHSSMNNSILLSLLQTAGQPLDAWHSLSTLCLKKVPTFKLSVTLSNLNRFSKFYTAGKRMKVATKPIRQSPPHHMHVATLPWEIKNSNFMQIFSRYDRTAKNCILIASDFVIHPQILIFSMFKIASLSP